MTRLDYEASNENIATEHVCRSGGNLKHLLFCMHIAVCYSRETLNGCATMGVRAQETYRTRLFWNNSCKVLSYRTRLFCYNSCKALLLRLTFVKLVQKCCPQGFIASFFRSITYLRDNCVLVDFHYKDI